MVVGMRDEYTFNLRRHTVKTLAARGGPPGLDEIRERHEHHGSLECRSDTATLSVMLCMAHDDRDALLSQADALRLDLLAALALLDLVATHPTDEDRARARELVAELGARWGLPGMGVEGDAVRGDVGRVRGR